MKKSLKLLLVLLSALFAVTTVTSCSIGDTLNTLGEVADLAAEVLDEIEDASTSVETGETNELPNENTEEPQPSESPSDEKIDENGSYTTKEDVALYLYTYGKLPNNFITKDEARALGWEGGGLDEYAEGKCIGGDFFGNYEGILPKAKGRTYTECDIDTLGKKSRGAKRIVFSNDGLIYYTEDHYESFELLYGEE